jgi:hypothetical protein
MTLVSSARRQELVQLRRQKREILSKAAAWFANEHALD